MNSIDQAVKSYLGQEGPPLPRVTLGAVNRDGTLYYAKCFEGGQDEPTRVDDVHWVASVTKFITSIAVMQCVEKGLLELDVDISTILPEWKDPKILTGFNEKNEPQFRPSKRPVTLRHLVTHSSGMSYSFAHNLATKYQELKGNPPPVVRTVKESFPIFLLSEPGEQWIYGTGFEWAGKMIEKVTEMRLGEYMRKNIFEPVAAHDITFHLNKREDLRARKVKLWERDGNELKEVTAFWWPDPAIDDLGGGGIYTNVLELLKIYLGVLKGKLLRSETVEMMFKPHLESRKNLDSPGAYEPMDRNGIYNAVPNNVPSDYGLGGLINTVELPGRRSQYSLTGSGLPNCYWWVDIKKGVAGVYLSQLLPTGDERAVELLTEFERAVYSTLD